ncbi:Trp biosynthesis-associated membrane protein [Arsenicicoccus dermatophilus]|uniref:Trp biosynthesis-associated membrane protein n=1 Tax=Arsenicicoccus dermatophilus TaxID=1076331 RepID=UPI0039173CB9
MNHPQPPVRPGDPTPDDPRHDDPRPDDPRAAGGDAPPTTPGTAGRHPTRSVLLLAALGAGLVLALITQTWATGSSTEALVPGSAISATGSALVPLAGALALAAAAAAVVSVTAGRIVRRLAAAALLLAGLGCAVAVAWFLRDPSAPLAADLAARTGRTSPPQVAAHPTWGAWAALAATAPLLVAGVLALARADRTRGLSRRYDAPTARPVSDATGTTTVRELSLWDRVTQEHDDEPPPTAT